MPPNVGMELNRKKFQKCREKESTGCRITGTSRYLLVYWLVSVYCVSKDGRYEGNPDKAGDQ